MRRALVSLTVLAAAGLFLAGAWRIGEAGGEAPPPASNTPAPAPASETMMPASAAAAIERIEREGVPVLPTSPGPEAEHIEVSRECDPTGSDCLTGMEIRPTAEQMAMWKAHTDEVLAACGKLPEDQQLACVNADTGWFPPGIAGENQLTPTPPEQMAAAEAHNAEVLKALAACGDLPREERTACEAIVWTTSEIPQPTG